MAPLTLKTNAIQVPSLPLTQESFLPFGTVIENTPSHRISAVSANQGTAQKIPSISPLINNYTSAPSGTTAKPSISMFICTPRSLRKDNEHAKHLFDVNILERHPYTTQTFTPMGLSASDPDTSYLVIVCPSQPQAPKSEDQQGQSNNDTSEPKTWMQEFTSRDQGSSTSQVGEQTVNGEHELVDPPDLPNIQAFVARGNQAVTYNAGTWHAPMVVLGKENVEFVVVQFVNGVAEEDCEEVEISAVDGQEGVVVVLKEEDGQAFSAVKAKI